MEQKKKVKKDLLCLTSRNRLLLINPFVAAMTGPAERCESQYMGASEFLNRRLNEEFQRGFEAGDISYWNSK